MRIVVAACASMSATFSSVQISDKRAAEHLVAPPAERVEQRPVHDLHAIVGVDRVDDLRQAVDQRAEQHALFFERRLGLAPLAPLARFRQRAHHDGRQALQPVLQHVVGRAALQRFDRAFLAERAGDEDEGNVGRVLQQDLQRRETVEAGQRVVGEHQVRRRAGQRLAEIALRDDVPPVDVDPVLRQLQLDQLGVVRIVLQQHEAQRCGRTFFITMRVEPSVRDRRATLSLCGALWKMRIAPR